MFPPLGWMEPSQGVRVVLGGAGHDHNSDILGARTMLEVFERLGAFHRIARAA